MENTAMQGEVMIYGVGVGQSGTRSLAKLMNGVWEGLPHICKEAVDYYLTGVREPVLIDKLKERAKIETFFIGNNKQSLVIDLIHEIDPTATFVWQIREPIGNIQALRKRGSYLIEGPSRRERIFPRGGFGEFKDHFSKICWLWKEKNLLIEQMLKKLGVKYRVVFADDIPYRLGVDCKDDLEIFDKQQKYLEDNIFPLWNRYEKEYSEESKNFVREMQCKTLNNFSIL